jgi:hypothetical protein
VQTRAYVFGETRVDTLALPTFTELPGSCPCGVAPNSRATPSSFEARQRSLQICRCLAPPRPAFYLANHQELCGALECFWAYTAYGSLTAYCPFRHMGRDSSGTSVLLRPRYRRRDILRRCTFSFALHLSYSQEARLWRRPSRLRRRHLTDRTSSQLKDLSFRSMGTSLPPGRRP